MLEEMRKTISLAQLAKHAERIADDIETGTVYRIKQPGRRAMILLDHQVFESRLATIEFMQRHPNWRRELAEARRQYEAGLYVPYEQVRKELGLAEPRRKPSRSSSARRTSTDRRARRR